MSSPAALAEALKQEIRERAAARTFVGQMMYISLMARKPR
jgi:hypothetical protein